MHKGKSLLFHSISTSRGALKAKNNCSGKALVFRQEPYKFNRVVRRAGSFRLRRNRGFASFAQEQCNTPLVQIHAPPSRSDNNTLADDSRQTHARSAVNFKCRYLVRLHTLPLATYKGRAGGSGPPAYRAGDQPALSLLFNPSAAPAPIQISVSIAQN